MTDVRRLAGDRLLELSGRLADDLAHLDAELAEVDLLVGQAQDRGRPATRRAGSAGVREAGQALDGTPSGDR